MGQKLEKLGSKPRTISIAQSPKDTASISVTKTSQEEDDIVVKPAVSAPVSPRRRRKKKEEKVSSEPTILSRFPLMKESEPFLSVYQLDDEEIIQGEGSFFTSTRKCYRRTDGAVFLAKRVEGKEALASHRNKIIQEVTLLQNMKDRPHSIVTLEAFFETDREMVLVFPLAVSDLYDHLSVKKRLSADEIRFLVREVVEAVAYLHINRILHRNLKTEVVLFMDVTKPAERRRAEVMTCLLLLPNVLREIVCGYEELPPRTLLTGFSLCELLDDKETVLSFAGTPEYMAPEVVKQCAAGTPSDMWGIGCMMFELFEGRPPYYNENITQMFQLISACAPLNFFHSPVPARELMTQLLSPSPELRPTAQTVLSHAFFTERNGNLSLASTSSVSALTSTASDSLSSS